MNPQDYIPKPCHEKWDTMTGSDRQKFCDKCSCSVHNLTGMNHEQIMILRNKMGGKLCGVFQPEQSVEKISKVRRSLLRKQLVIGASISSLALAACNEEQHPEVIGECIQACPTQSNSPKKVPIKPIEPLRTLGQICPPETLMGDICPPEKPEPPKPPKKEPRILGKICAPK